MTGRKRSPSRGSPAPAPVLDQAGMREAIRRFLEAAGVPLTDPELAHTPERVAEAWANDFLDGYRTTVAEALGGLSPAPKGGGLVVVTGLDFTGVCPHHLLPYRGVAHLAYLPGKSVAGFGRLATLLDALSHRLVLQEELARNLAEALVTGLGAVGAGVILEAEQTCMTLRGEKKPRSRTTVDATFGRFPSESLTRLWAAAKGGSSFGGER